MTIPELMTLEEVAKYLRVSERTVYDWAQKGEIPAGKLGGSWRFKRDEVKKWVEDRLIPGSAKAINSIDLDSVLSPGRITIMSAKDKVEALNVLIDLLATAPEVKSRDELADAIFRREKLMSTGIGLGIALPHVRLASVSNVVMAIGINRTDITDYQSLDGQPVRIICMIAAGKYQHTKYLKTLVAISPYLRTEKIRQALLNASDAQSVADLLLKGGAGQ
jgi:PTS system nitrogen regulatory IIA component